MSTQSLPLPPPLPPLRYVQRWPQGHAPSHAGAGSRRRRAEVAPGLWLVATFTLALWLLCISVGVAGMILHYPGAHLPAVDTPVVAQLIHVDLSNDPSPADNGASADKVDFQPPPSPDSPPPAAPQPPSPPDAPPLMAVATPEPAIAFAVPVKGPAHIVDAKQAAPQQQQPGTAANAGASTVKHLTFGRGEGTQPSPEYPREAILAREEGVVTVRFNVGRSGAVTSADLAEPCRWPMLNQAALRAVRDRWHFPPGEPRLYEIVIHFQLQ